MRIRSKTTILLISVSDSVALGLSTEGTARRRQASNSEATSLGYRSVYRYYDLRLRYNFPLALGSSALSAEEAEGTVKFCDDSRCSPPSRSTSPIDPASAVEKSMNANDLVKTANTSTEEKRNFKVLDLPWSGVHEGALRDALPRFTVQVPVCYDDTTSFQACVLWRSLTNEVPELSGYPLPFILARYRDMLREEEEATNSEDEGDSYGIHGRLPQTNNEILPYLDQFAFENSGGLSGCVYGARGVADGTRIRTTPLGNVPNSIPKGFVQTEDGSVVYELGEPLQQEGQLSFYGVDGENHEGSSGMRSVARSMSRIADPFNIEPIINDDLAKLGVLTMIVIGGALAVQALSHHLTINIFWVG